jgi:hypothetical protein
MFTHAGMKSVLSPLGVAIGAALFQRVVRLREPATGTTVTLSFQS